MSNKPLIIITGASSGFGAKTAEIFNQKGFPLLLIARRVEKIKQLPLNFENILIENIDVTQINELNAAIKKAESIYGPADLLVNNAGVMLLGNITEQDESEWQTMLQTNVIGVLNGMKAVLGNMTKRNQGTIINVSSIAGYKAFVDHAAYAASKFGVHGLTETIRQEVADSNVRVSLVSPGAAETELLTHVTNEKSLTDYNSWKESMGGLTLDPAKVAETIFFIYNMPQEVTIREISIAATKQQA
ncbi:NADP-dependent 3-hydroxy acid dehydrogenase YdfG [Vagococcus fluvialis]|jgi:NADP-dependent 3-hydroxy acid dehydrogenase YdfG|uniref:Oxidoreductase n=1 Tax=Vagococcus fluvialis TaxID=2738 RepID=A0A369B2B6_9ENTE|nr:SDR family oxidoreductase [Vagococcus fluvialis]MDR2276270.1 SDR family oxidoreductase [Vagococcus sp.]RCX14718.1 NADP-dependent 3-hydroxy acid dehydrogenase YdfG [Vagococcus fluvialis]RSU03781.1 oxidoreductase [Vagococcus fluvialis]WNF90525.1 SDR family oxidoreductase [Vagococcus fluvialis]